MYALPSWRDVALALQRPEVGQLWRWRGDRRRLLKELLQYEEARLLAGSALDVHVISARVGQNPRA